jgi:hypothetical protein
MEETLICCQMRIKIHFTVLCILNNYLAIFTKKKNSLK